MAKTEKQKAWDACSKYIRLRDAILYCEEAKIIDQLSVEFMVVRCCTCETIKIWRYMDAGHFIGRGIGGSSGVYFDERNINTQCKPCNGFEQGSPIEYREFMLDKYGQRIIDELRIKHHSTPDYGSVACKAIEIFYKEEFEKLNQKVKDLQKGL